MAVTVSRSATCSVMQIRSFGGFQAGGYDRRANISLSTPAFDTFEEFLKQVRRSIKYYDDGVDYAANSFHNCGLVEAHISELQVHALKVMEAFGGWTISKSQLTQKYNHEIFLFVQPIRQFTEIFNEWAKVYKVDPLVTVPQVAHNHTILDGEIAGWWSQKEKSYDIPEPTTPCIRVWDLEGSSEV
jgi:hypothetical protein